MRSPTGAPSTKMALKLSRTAASGCSAGTMAGCTRTPTPRRVGLLGHREQLHDVAHLPGEGDVDLGDAGDALVVDVGGGDGDAEGDAGDDGGLGAGVVALHVRGGVGLAKPRAWASPSVGVGGAGSVILVRM